MGCMCIIDIGTLTSQRLTTLICKVSSRATYTKL